MKRLVCPGLCFTLSLSLVFGSILLSPTVINVALANDMSNAPMTKDTITAGSGGDEEDEGDQGDDLEDAPVTRDTITVDRGSDNDDDNSGQSSGDNNSNDNNDNEPATTEVTEGPNCPKNQEQGLFGSCLPNRACGNDVGVLGTNIPILNPESNNCVNAPIVDHPSAEN